MSQDGHSDNVTNSDTPDSDATPSEDMRLHCNIRSSDAACRA
jgi:hypothetical protein